MFLHTDVLFYIMTKSNKINFENILLDNYDVQIDITFGPPSQSKNNSDFAISNRSSPSNSHIRKTEDYIHKKFHQTAVDRLKKQIITEVTEEVKHCNKPVETVTNQRYYTFAKISDTVS